jgi:uncharacterized protein YodC (DUF2158 family)
MDPSAAEREFEAERRAAELEFDARCREAELEFEAKREAGKKRWHAEHEELLVGFGVNDVVRLVSGGPRMTIVHIYPWSDQLEDPGVTPLFRAQYERLAPAALPPTTADDRIGRLKAFLASQIPNRVPPPAPSPRAKCKWFDNHGRVREATFELALLKKPPGLT